MKISSIEIGKLTIPLLRPFITAVRRTENVEDVVVTIKTTDSKIGYGSAASTPLITGDTTDSIITAIQNILAPKLLGQEITNLNALLYIVQQSLHNNSSAKAAIDMALYDLFAQSCNIPLYKLLGGTTNELNTCITISVKGITEMADDAKLLVSQGFTTLKIKVGLDPIEDVKRVTAIRQAVGEQIKILVDANQGWESKNALKVIEQITALNVELVEQPVKAVNLEGLKFIRERTNSKIFADEACFSPQDAINIVKNECADGINIKLMKSGGLYNANTIYQIAKASHLKCMVGCMLESPIGIAAMASFALSKPDILFADLDAIALIKENPLIGGAKLLGNKIILANTPGLGITGFNFGYNQISEVK